MSSLQGSLLVAMPELADGNFHRTVVLIVRHSTADGALGLVLNRPTGTTIKELWERMGEDACECDLPLNLGGPCEGPLMALHRDGTAGEVEILPGLFFTASSDRLRQLVTNPQAEVRFFCGYSGWGAGQLEMELRSGAWRLEPAAAKHVFATAQELWERSSAEAAGWEVLAALKLKGLPADPSMN